MITVAVNARPLALDGPMTLAELLGRELKVDSRFIAVARNGDVVPREEHGSVVVQDGDTLEIVRAVGGG